MSAADLDRRWDETVRAALLGTEREASADPPSIDLDAPALDRALARLAERGSEARLLGTAAVLSLYRRAGRLPRRDERPLPEPAPEETARRAPPAAARVLARMLAGEHAVVLPEWMAMAADRGMVVPEELLPRLMDAAWSRSEVRPGIFAVMGARGRWLAARNPAWRWAAGEAAEGGETWETASPEVCADLLRRMRRTDPARGLDLLRSTWDTDPARVRASLLSELAAGISGADEPFLEAALDDRSKEVRRAAAELLRRLPDSRLAARMTERARPMLRITPPMSRLLPGKRGKPRIEVELPAECTPEMRRDGIDPAPPLRTGEKAWWLRQVVAAVPPSVWSGASGVAPAELIEAARLGDYEELLLGAWSAATAGYGDAEWAEALATVRGTASHRVDHLAVLGALPPDRVRALALGLVSASRDLAKDDAALRLLWAIPHPLGAELTRAVLARIRPEALQGYNTLTEGFRRIAPLMDPPAALAATAGWDPAARGAWIDTLHFRHALHEAFAS